MAQYVAQWHPHGKGGGEAGMPGHGGGNVGEGGRGGGGVEAAVRVGAGRPLAWETSWQRRASPPAAAATIPITIGSSKSGIIVLRP